jgi:NADPH:quinone reductase-like Zn-dependent oxidoreductase
VDVVLFRLKIVPPHQPLSFSSVHQGWFLESETGTFQQYTLCPAELVSKIPDSLTFDDAATIPVGLGAAVIGLFNPIAEGGLALTPFWSQDVKYKDKPIVIFGGTSSVGQYVIQVARLSGFSPIITTSSLKHEDYLKGLGATHVIDRNSEDVVGKIKALLPNGAVGVVYDAISMEETQKMAVQLSKADGKILLTLSKIEGLDFGDRTTSHTFGNVHDGRKIGIQLYSVLLNYLQDGCIKVQFPFLGDEAG